MSPLLQGSQRFCISIMPAGLKENLPVPFKTKPLKCAEDVIGRTGQLSRRVEVLHADQPFSRFTPGLAIRCHCRQKAAEMQTTGGGRCEAANGATS